MLIEVKFIRISYALYSINHTMFAVRNIIRQYSTSTAYQLPMPIGYRQNIFWLNYDIAKICREHPDQKQAIIHKARSRLATYIAYNTSNDWADQVKYSSGFYTKIPLVRPLTPDYGIYLINWLPGQTSPIHGHPCGGCVMGVLRGSLKETIYPATWSMPARTELLTQGMVGYIDDSIGCHQIRNMGNIACNSLHIYFYR